MPIIIRLILDQYYRRQGAIKLEEKAKTEWENSVTIWMSTTKEEDSPNLHQDAE